jgi:ActR/RegA family two-component response regulator
MSESSPESTAAAPVAQLVRSLLERHAIPRHRHASYVGEFFRLSRAAAHQRVTRSNAWTLEEVQALAQHFGESLSEVVRSPSASPDSHAARMHVGALRLDCEVWLGGDAGAGCTDALVAVREGEGPWTVVPSTTAALWQIVRRIDRLEIRPTTTRFLRVAVVDADHAAAATVCTQLAASGLEPLAYPSVEDLLNSAGQQDVDAWVVDWHTAAQAGGLAFLRSLRSGHEKIAMILLSGGTRTGRCDALAVAEAAVILHAQVLEKPVQVPFLVAALSNGFGSRACGPAAVEIIG